MPRVSVIMPVYNENEEFLNEAVTSILNQTFKDFEFIIINDGSTNNTEEVILSYNDPRIIYVKNEQNLKIIKTLNKGLKLAKGEYIARMDSDDICAPQKLQRQVEFLDANPNFSLAGTHASSIPQKLHYALPSDSKTVKTMVRYCANCIIHPAIMMRKSVLDKNNLQYNENYPHAEDFKLWVELAKDNELTNIPEILFLHRLHKKSISAQNAALQQLISDKILFECLGEDFDFFDKSCLQAALKYLNGIPLNLNEIRAIERFFLKLLPIITLNTQEIVRKTILERYRRLWINILSLGVPSFGYFVTLYLSKLNKNLNVGQEVKSQLEKAVRKRGKSIG